MVNYPNGRTNKSQDLHTKDTEKRKIEYGKRGMRFETDIDQSNKYYLTEDIAVIHKKPVPVQIVSVDYPRRESAVIREAYFQKPSTTDYNGIYRGKYIDFEAKATNNKTSFPLINIHAHQIEHMEKVAAHGGIAFILIYFAVYDTTYLVPVHDFMPFWERCINGGKKSVSLTEIKEVAVSVPSGFRPRIDYLKVVDQLFFNE